MKAALRQSRAMQRTVVSSIFHVQCSPIYLSTALRRSNGNMMELCEHISLMRLVRFTVTKISCGSPPWFSVFYTGSRLRILWALYGRTSSDDNYTACPGYNTDVSDCGEVSSSLTVVRYVGIVQNQHVSCLQPQVEIHPVGTSINSDWFANSFIMVVCEKKS